MLTQLNNVVDPGFNADPYWFQYGSGSGLVPDPTFYLIAIQIRIQGTKPRPINADPDQDPGHKEVEYLHEKYT
jgi:hypothetical protein